MNTIWWLLGLGAVVGGGVYIYSRTTGKPVEKKDVCIADLPIAKLTLTNSAIKSKDAPMLLSFAAQADAQGWTCAAAQMRVEAARMTSGLIAKDAGGAAEWTPGGADDGGIFGMTKPKPKESPVFSLALDVSEKTMVDALPDEPAGKGLRTDVQHALSGSATRDEICALADFLEGTGSYVVVAKIVRKRCSDADAAISAKAATAALSIDELPEPLRSTVKYSIAKIPSGAVPYIAGWAMGASDISKQLTAGGYKAAEKEYTSYFLPSVV